MELTELTSCAKTTPSDINRKGRQKEKENVYLTVQRITHTPEKAGSGNHLLHRTHRGLKPIFAPSTSLKAAGCVHINPLFVRRLDRGLERLGWLRASCESSAFLRASTRRVLPMPERGACVMTVRISRIARTTAKDLRVLDSGNQRPPATCSFLSLCGDSVSVPEAIFCWRC